MKSVPPAVRTWLLLGGRRAAFSWFESGANPAVGPVLPEIGTNCNGWRFWAPAGQNDNISPAFLCLQGWRNQPTQKTADAGNHKNITSSLTISLAPQL